MKSIRPKIRKLHRLLGVPLALLLFIQGMSGLAIAFRHDIDRMLHPALDVQANAKAVPLAALVREVRAANPDHRLARLEFPRRSHGSILFSLYDEDSDALRIVAVDPSSGRVVRAGGLDSWPTHKLLYLHAELLGGAWGHMIVGVVGVLLMTMVISGLISWWPGRRRVWQSLRVSTKGGAVPAVSSLHRLIGALVAPLLLISAATGALMVWKPLFRSALAMVTATVPKPTVEVAERPGQALMPLDQLVASVVPAKGELREVRFPDASGRIVTVYVGKRDISGAVPDQIWFDGYTGRELARYTVRDLPTGNRVVEWLLPIHSGSYAGLFSRSMMAFAALALMFLAGSGLWFWLRRRLRRITRPI